MIRKDYEYKTYEDYIDDLGDRYPELNRNDMLLTGIYDWNDFNIKLRK